MNNFRLPQREIDKLEKLSLPFPEKLKLVRKLTGCTRQEFILLTGLDSLGVSRQSLYQWESGICKPNIYKIIFIIKSLGLTFKALFSYELGTSEQLNNGKTDTVYFDFWKEYMEDQK